jgi:hypothetical protein
MPLDAAHCRQKHSEYRKAGGRRLGGEQEGAPYQTEGALYHYHGLT